MKPYKSRYREVQSLRNFIAQLAQKYRIINNGGLNIVLVFEKHLIDRLIDRYVPKQVISNLITRIIKHHICELIYLFESGERKCRVYEECGYMIPLSLYKYPDGNYSFKIHTIYKESKYKETTMPKIITTKEKQL